MDVRAHAPGRVNLIGDHTDYAGGLALPFAIDLGTTIDGTIGGDRLSLVSSAVDERVDLPIGATEATGWGRYAAAVAAELGIDEGFTGSVMSDLPIGSGLSSSASLEIALALALGFEGTPLELARLGQRTEHRAVGVPCGLLDQLAIVEGRSGHAMCIDFADLSIEHVPIPDDLDIVVVHSGQERALADSQYAERQASCGRAASIVGPLATADIVDIDRIPDETVRMRARHVSTECARVREAVDALRRDDRPLLGALMTGSHRSLRDDFEVSTPKLDRLVERLLRVPGVHGARLTGAGFGGCVVAIAERGAIPDPTAFSRRGWIVRPADGATCDRGDRPSWPGTRPR
mgnify:CR=1 FL=1